MPYKMKKVIGFFANADLAIAKINSLNNSKLQGDNSVYSFESLDFGFVVFGIIKFSESLQNEIDNLFNS